MSRINAILFKALAGREEDPTKNLVNDLLADLVREKATIKKGLIEKIILKTNKGILFVYKNSEYFISISDQPIIDNLCSSIMRRCGLNPGNREAQSGEVKVKPNKGEEKAVTIKAEPEGDGWLITLERVKKA